MLDTGDRISILGQEGFLPMESSVYFQTWQRELGKKTPESFCRVFSISFHLYTSSLHAATAKLLQSCPTLCDPIDGSPPGSTVPGTLQARTWEWVAISFSNTWKWNWKWSRSCSLNPASWLSDIVQATGMCTSAVYSLVYLLPLDREVFFFFFFL